MGGRRQVSSQVVCSVSGTWVPRSAPKNVPAVEHHYESWSHLSSVAMETFPLPDAQRKAADNGSDRELPMEHVTPGASRLRGLCRPAASPPRPGSGSRGLRSSRRLTLMVG